MAAGHAAELEQLQAERLDLGQHAMQRRLVGQIPGKYGLGSVCPRLQARERTEEGLTQMPSDADLVTGRSRRFIHGVRVQPLLASVDAPILTAG